MFKKRQLCLTILILLCLTAIPLPVLAADINVTIDNNTLSFDVPPTILNGRTLVPLRSIFESLGASVEWENSTKTITGVRENTTIKLQVDNPTALRNEQALSLDVPATIIANRTLVPTRFIAEALGAEVNWNQDTRTVEIKSNLPYKLAEYYILENNVRQLASTLDEGFYQEFEATIRSHFNPQSFVLLETYLERTYPTKRLSHGIYTGPSLSGRTQGIYQEVDGGKYVGDFLDGNLEGKGAYYFPDGGKYIGEWQNNRRNGWGTLYTSGGDIYIGEWRNDSMEGHGIYYWKNGETYRGQWVNNHRSGLGSYTWTDGNEYIGQSFSDEMSGQGSFNWNDGKQYLGEYSAGKKSGRGVYYWKPDFVFRGQFSSDRQTWGTYQGPGGHFLNLQENAQKIVSEVIKPEMTSRAKLKALHDYVALQTSYDEENLQSGTIPPESHTAYGAFVNKKAVCDGYAEALHTLLQAAGIESIIVEGEAKGKNGWEGHAWLIVKIDGKYAHVDVTWNDLDQGEQISYDYFLVSDDKIAADHYWDRSLYPPSPN